MKNNFRKAIAIILALCVCTFILVSCKDDEPKITEAFIISELANSDGDLDGTLTITKGTSENVSAFKYTLKNVNASSLTNKNYVRGAVEVLMSKPGNITYNELKVCNAFNATAQVVGIFYEDENFDSNAFTEEILNIVCSGSTRNYAGWAISASADTASDSIIIEATRN